MGRFYYFYWDFMGTNGVKIVADENIPWVSHYFGDAILKPGRQITSQDLVDAEMLLVRSITNVDRSLLQNTQIKFVGSTTTGADHIDTAWLDENNITYRVAKGCNADAVLEYVIAILASLQKRNFLPTKKLRAAVIGVGTIGSKVVEKLEWLGMEVICCDPIRAINEPDFQSIALDKISDVDFITLHTPLTNDGEYPTFHMINKDFLTRQKNNCILLNTSRGGVINSNDLKLYGGHLMWCLDVFEGEPFIDFEMLDEALIATPHIAGYSEQAKYRGIEMIYQAAHELNIIPTALPQIHKRISCDVNSIAKNWRDVVLQIFDPYELSSQMKVRMIEDPDHAFDDMRKNFKTRNEFRFIDLVNMKVDEQNKKVLEQLGFGL